jgi:hypothetical protein
VNGLFGALGVKQPIFVTGLVWPKKRVYWHPAPIFMIVVLAPACKNLRFLTKNGHFFVSALVV